VLDEVRRLAVITSGVAELTRNRAEQLVKSALSGEGGGARAELVRQLIDASRQNRHEVIKLIRAEIRSQIQGLGLASVREVERLERRVARLEQEARGDGKSPKKPASPKKTTGPKKTTVPRKTTARRKTPRPRPAPAETPLEQGSAVPKPSRKKTTARASSSASD